MIEINFNNYSDIVKSNQSFFNDLDKKLSTRSLQLKLLSKNHFNNKVINDFNTYYEELTQDGINFSINSLLQSFISNFKSYKIHPEAIIYFIYFDLGFSKKLNKGCFEEAIKNLYHFVDINTKTHFWLNIGIPAHQDSHSSTPSFYYINHNNNHFTGNFNIYNFTISLPSLFSSYKNKDTRIKNIISFVFSSSNIFPSSTILEFKNIQKKNNESPEMINKLDNLFLYKIYLSQLPEKYSQSFFKNEFSRLTNHYNYSEKDKIIYSSGLILKAFYEKYNKDILNKKWFLNKVFSIFHHSSSFKVKKLSKQQKKDIFIHPFKEIFLEQSLHKIGFNDIF
jgi:hypothetical protein